MRSDVGRKPYVRLEWFVGSWTLEKLWNKAPDAYDCARRAVSSARCARSRGCTSWYNWTGLLTLMRMQAEPLAQHAAQVPGDVPHDTTEQGAHWVHKLKLCQYECNFRIPTAWFVIKSLNECNLRIPTAWVLIKTLNECNLRIPTALKECNLRIPTASVLIKTLNECNFLNTNCMIGDYKV
jgi:hypothetical protein